MKVYALINNKGGVGKSASATTIGHAATLDPFNKKVLLIDLDPQGNTSSLYSDIPIIQILAAMLKNESPSMIKKSVEDLFVDDKLDIHEVIQHTKYPNLDIIPSLLTLSEIEERLKADIRIPQQFRLAKHLQAVQDEYDVCILDCSPSVSIININGLVAADEVFIPIKCDAWSAIGMCIAKNLIMTVSSYNPRLKIGGIFFTQWEERKNISQEVYGLLMECVADSLLPITISRSKLIEEVTLMQEPLLVYDSGKKKNKITKEYMALTEYLISDNKRRREILNTYQKN